MQPLINHLSADKTEKYKGNPGNGFLKNRECFQKAVHAEPAKHGHKKLKKGKCSRNPVHGTPGHAGIVQPIGNGNGKGIHGQTGSQENTVGNK